MFLKNEQSLLENHHHSNSSIASTRMNNCRSPSRPPSLYLCMNPACKKPGHTIEYCIKPGGGMAGRSIEELVAARQTAWDRGKKNSTSSQSSSRVPITVKDVNGRAFTVMLNSASM
ncbi:hypothetical protein L208DRAFT_1487574 [Tricholoma matsutake]|nr:hypothetical protein L208DRAFT_1487574 [Tricholoma matsutake 945]